MLIERKFFLAPEGASAEVVARELVGRFPGAQCEVDIIGIPLITFPQTEKLETPEQRTKDSVEAWIAKGNAKVTKVETKPAHAAHAAHGHSH